MSTDRRQDDTDRLDETLKRVSDRLEEIRAAVVEEQREFESLPSEERDRIMAERSRERELERLSQLQRRIEETVPIAFRHHLEVDRRVALWLQAFTSRESNDGLLLVGATGRGKTHTMWEIVKHMIVNGWDGHFRFEKVPMLLTSLRPRSDVSEHETITKLQRTDLLLLDDLGAHKVSEWTEDKLFQILDYRVDHELAVVISTNIPAPNLSKTLGDRVASRVGGLCRTRVALGGPDYRLEDMQGGDS